LRAIVWSSEKPTARRKRRKSEESSGRAESMLNRFVIPRAELAERSEDETDHATAVPKSASWSVLVVRACVVVESDADNRCSVGEPLGAG
jgi:hypothetical protein